MYPHCMRLRGPWECEPLARFAGGAKEPLIESDHLPPPRQMMLPCRWSQGGLVDFAGRVRFVRHFGYPTRIDPHERLWLTFAGVEGVAEVWLNGHYLGRHDRAGEAFDYEVTNLLRPRNELKVEVESRSPDGGMWGEVALEVRCSAFLRNVQISFAVVGNAVDLKATGEVVGTSELPLEVHLLLEGKMLVFHAVKPTVSGQPFELFARSLQLELGTPGNAGTMRLYTVRVDLVQGTMIWYGVKQSMVFQPAQAMDDTTLE